MIRPGTIEDLPQLILLGERLRLESGVWFPPVDEEYLRSQPLFGPERCCFVGERGSNIVGWLNGLIAAPYEWSPFRVAVQRVLYVAPEARGGFVARDLIRAFVGWAEAQGLTRQMIGLGNGLDPATVDHLYRGLGFRPVGGQYLRDSWESKPPSPSSGRSAV